MGNAVLAGVDNSLVENAFQYGGNIGIAFQLVDDLLDFTVSADQLGKPAAADLKLGLATAPVLFAAEKYPGLNDDTAEVQRARRCGDCISPGPGVRRSAGDEGAGEETLSVSNQLPGVILRLSVQTSLDQPL